MILRLRTALAYGIIPLYLALFFAGVFGLGWFGTGLSFLLLFAAMWAFARLPRPPLQWVLAGLLMLFYTVLYWSELLTPVAVALGLGTKWVLYGALYTLFVLGFGVDFLLRHRSEPYQVVRTLSVMAVQLILAFLLPILLPLFNQPEYYFSYVWPLKIEYFYPDVIFGKPLVYIVYSFTASLVLFPLLALLFGKRFYCSWVCGCGALAETFGDRWRHLSDKSGAAWRFERVSIHSMLAVAVAGTAIVLLRWYLATRRGLSTPVLDGAADRFTSFYGYVGSFILTGVVGTGFYPILGSRVWCRFFCPLAALIGLTQKAGRFHIRVKSDMCISCGNCSTYCEMGIDVRAYAQQNTSFTRASCVGCGMCASVCPRGVLRLENRRLRPIGGRAGSS